MEREPTVEARYGRSLESTHMHNHHTVCGHMEKRHEWRPYARGDVSETDVDNGGHSGHSHDGHAADGRRFQGVRITQSRPAVPSYTHIGHDKSSSISLSGIALLLSLLSIDTLASLLLSSLDSGTNCTSCTRGIFPY